MSLPKEKGFITLIIHIVKCKVNNVQSVFCCDGEQQGYDLINDVMILVTVPYTL